MRGPFTAEVSKDLVVLDEARSGRLQLTVRNTSGQPMVVRTRVASEHPSLATWILLRAGPEHTLDIDGEVTVPVEVSLPEDPGEGPFVFRFVAEDVQQPDARCVESASVTVRPKSSTVRPAPAPERAEEPAPAPPEPPPPPPRKAGARGWVGLVAGGLVLVAIGVAVLVVVLDRQGADGPEPGSDPSDVVTPTPSPSPAPEPEPVPAPAEPSPVATPAASQPAIQRLEAVPLTRRLAPGQVGLVQATAVGALGPLPARFDDASVWTWEVKPPTGATLRALRQGARVECGEGFRKSVQLTLTHVPTGLVQRTRVDCTAPSNDPVTGALVLTPPKGPAPLHVALAAKDAAAVGWRWDLGDGTTAEGPFVQHIYREPGTYSVRLSVVGTGGRAAETAEPRQVTVLP